MKNPNRNQLEVLHTNMTTTAADAADFPRIICYFVPFD